MKIRYLRRLEVCLLLFYGVYFPIHAADATQQGKDKRGSVSANNCKLIQWNRISFAHPYLPIDEPGKYCINQDYRLSCINGAGDCGSSPLIEIIADNVDLDLQGHTLSRAGRPLEIFGRGFNISIKNGFIRNGSIRIRTPDTPNETINGDEPMEEPVLKEDRSILVENIHIESGGIFVSAANALIRNNEITSEADDLAPICVYGPHSVIENNMLRRITNVSKFHSYGIYLRNSSGSIIRENIITNKGTRVNTFTFGLRNSRGVTIKDNKIHNFSTTVERLGQSDEQQIGNNLQ
jgi:hypothetical protein